MTSEEAKEDSKEENPTTLSRKTGNPPMIHASADVLKEFTCPDPSENNKNESKDNISEFDLPDLKSSSNKTSIDASIPVSETNGISSPSDKKQEGKDAPEDSAEVNNVSDSTPLDRSLKPLAGSSVSSPLSEPLQSSTSAPSNECSLDPSPKKDVPSESQIVTTNIREKSSTPDGESTTTKSNETKENTYSEIPKKDPKIFDESSSKSGDDETKEKSNSMKSTEENVASSKSAKENQEEYNSEDDSDDMDDPQPGTPLSETLSQISLEETLLKDDDNDSHDDHEMDDFTEERLLQESETVKGDDRCTDDTGMNSASRSNSGYSLHLFGDVGDDCSKGSQNASDSSHSNNNTINKILQDLDSSSEDTMVDSSSSTTLSSTSQKDYEVSDNSSKKSGSSLLSRDDASQNGKLSDTSSTVNDSTNHVEEKTARSLPLPENSENSASSHKRSLPADFMEGAKSNVTPCKMMRKDSSIGKKRTTTESASTSPQKGSPLTFREALQSIAMEDQLRSSDKPQPLIPTTEICSSGSEKPSQTVLQSLDSNREPKSVASSYSKPASQEAKKVLILNGEMNGSKPNLKKIRVIKASPNDILKKGDVCRDVQSINLELIEMSKKIESVKTMESRLQEEKALQRNKKSSSNTLPRESFVHIDKDELDRRTSQELRNANLGNSKLKRIKRKDLESLVIELFVDKVLYEHQLGQQKDLCKRLEATLETNRKKAAQFHKEVDDLKKVTQRLQAEHAARKNQIMAPVRVKRSVGIQATPTIIGKGIMQASTNTNVRILTPSTNSSSSSSSSTSTISDSTNDSSQVTQVTQTPTFATQCVMSSPPVSVPSQASAVPAAQMVVMNPVVVQQQSQNAAVGSQILTPGTTRLVRAPLTSITSPQTAPLTATPLQGGISSSRTVTTSSIIDLTEDDEGSRAPRATVPTGSVLTFQRSSGVSIGQNTSGQFVTLNPPSSVGPFVLVPPTSLGQTATALVVGNVANNTQTLTTVGTPVRSSLISAGGPTARFSSPTTIVRVNGSNFMTPITRHPAPLPKAPPQQTSGYSKKLPPVPILKLSQKDSSIVLSWNMAKTDEHESIASYQLYAYQEGTTPPNPSLWKKVGSVKALELPMACTLTQFMPGHVYHFAVRAVDIRSRMGPFSDPRSVRLGKQVA